MNPKPAPQTVLVVDDEPEILRLVDAILTAKGYKVVLAKGSDQAIKAWEKMPQKPELILTDVVMPGMSGPMLVEHLQQSHPETQVLFMSGYDDRQLVRAYVVEKGFSLIAKPFNIHQLAASVKQALEGAERDSGLEPAR